VKATMTVAFQHSAAAKRNASQAPLANMDKNHLMTIATIHMNVLQDVA